MVDHQEHSATFGGKLACFDSKDVLYDGSLPDVMTEAQATKAKSLAGDEVDEEVNSEGGGRADRFRKTSPALSPMDVLFLEPSIEESKASDRYVPVTRTFDYDTSDSRTQDPTFVKNRTGKRRRLSTRSYSVGEDESAFEFALELDALRVEVVGKEH